MTGSIKKIKNVFISYKENDLQLADLRFDGKIRKIVPRTNRPLPWKEIGSKELWEKFKKQLGTLPAIDKNSYDGRFCLLIPAAIDAHVHFDTPGFEVREDFEHGSLAAAYGGVTTVLDMPCTSLPPVTNLANLLEKEQAVAGRSWVDYAFWGGVAGNDFAAKKDIGRQVRELAEAGVVGFKTYLVSGMETFRELSVAQMLHAAKLIKGTGLPLAVHAEDRKLVAEREKKYRAEGQNNWQAYCNARDVAAEAAAVSAMNTIARKSESRIHIVHLSSKSGLEIVRSAREQGVKFTAETCPHYLRFTQGDFNNRKISAFLKTAPPVKKQRDRQALWQGLADSSLEFVTTDHAGCDPQKEKSDKNFWKIYGGFPGVEHRVPFLFSEGFKKGRLSLEKTIALLSGNPAKFFGLNSKGSLEKGKDADMTLIDLWSDQKISATGMHSKGKFTPFEGITFQAVVETTFLRGKIIMQRGGNPEVDLGYGQRIWG